MRKMRSVVVAVVAAVVYCMSLSPAMAKDEAVKISKASKVIKEIAAIPKYKIPPELLKGASAIVLVPGAAKNDFMASGKSSGGVLLVHDKEGKWSSPVFVRLSGGTLGWQMVSDPMDIVLVFKDMKNVDAIMKGKLTMNAKIAIVPGWFGPDMKGAPPRELKAEIASYVRSHGAFVETAVVADSTLQIDAAANDAFYTNPKVAAGDIASGKVFKSTEDVKALQKLLTDYAAAK
jgi:lipid-binding SYLF domain-containing protein